MQIHDWTRVDDGTFHDFHGSWITHLKEALNDGVLPHDYIARGGTDRGRVRVGHPGPAPAVRHERSLAPPGAGVRGGRDACPPATAFTFVVDVSEFTARQRSVVIRHSSSRRVVAFIEVVSRGKKSSAYAFDTFVTKVAAALAQGVHVLVLDLHPPTPRDPNGIHAAIWKAIHAGTFRPPEGRPLTLAGYDAGPIKKAYVEPAGVGGSLSAMPLFLEPGYHVNAPLEPTYMRAWEKMPAADHEALEG